MGRRADSRLQAKIMKQSGEQVNLLLVNEAAPSTATPLSVVAADEAPDLSAAQRVPIFAHVHWHALGEVKYEEGGRAIFRKADIETTSDWMSMCLKAVAVEMQDGSILRKSGENISDTKATYTMTVEGYVAVPQ